MKIDYTNLSFTQLINKIEANRFFDLPRMTREAFRRLLSRVEALEDAPLVDSRPYKVYTALLTQSGTNAPVATVLENTLGTISFTYEDIGTYNIASNGLFIEGKTWYDISSASETGSMNDGLGGLKRTDVNNILVSTISSGVDVTNDILNSTPIEIRVYN